MCCYDNQTGARMSAGQSDIGNPSTDIDNGLYQNTNKASSGKNTGAASSAVDRAKSEKKM